jgi:hypothetical protein
MAEVKQTQGKRKVGDGTPGPGRPKGSTNKATKALKDMILSALDQAGGEAYLLAQAKKNPQAFMTLIGKVLPTTIQGSLQLTTISERLKRAEERAKNGG